MRAYLVISAAPGGAGAAAVSRATAAARRVAVEALPYPPAVGRAEEWLAAGGATALLGWTNEPDHELVPPLIERSATRAIGITGYLADAQDPAALLAAPDLGAAADRTGGCFGVFRVTPDGFEAATTLARIDPVYVAGTSDLRIAGSRALLVHLVAESIRTGDEWPSPDYDLLALHTLVRHGFFVSDDTPFRGVTALAAASTLVATGASSGLARRAPSAWPEPRLDVTHDEIRDLAAAVVGAVEPLRRHAVPPVLGLSGGRDSRLVAAALHAAGIAFHASTRGFEDQADTIGARLVASRLGVEHHRVWSGTIAADQDRVVVEHPLERAYRTTWIGEGMNSAIDDLVPFRRRFVIEPRLSGSGGEIIRGGYLYDQASLARAAIRLRIERLFTSGSHLLVPDANERARAALAAWDATAPPDGAEALAELYLLYRAGRWLVGPRTATLLSSTSYHPLLDNLVVRRATAIPALARWNERAIHALITRLAPPLRDLPLQGHRWRYEQRGPRSLLELRGWRRRHVITGEGRTATFDWRRHHDARFVALLREAVLDGPPVLWDLVRRDAVEPLFDTVPVSDPAIVWRLLGLSALLSGRWRRGEWAPLGTVEVPTPRVSA